jgi:hypothetical protein
VELKGRSKKRTLYVHKEKKYRADGLRHKVLYHVNQRKRKLPTSWNDKTLSDKMGGRIFPRAVFGKVKKFHVWMEPAPKNVRGKTLVWKDAAIMLSKRGARWDDNNVAFCTGVKDMFFKRQDKNCPWEGWNMFPDGSPIYVIAVEVK